MQYERVYTLIIGGNEGIGFELAKLFAIHKHNLIIVARNKNKLEAVKNNSEKIMKLKLRKYNVIYLWIKLVKK